MKSIVNLEHKPVLLNEVLENLAILEDGIYVDATFGRGGHAKAILEKLDQDGQLLVIDKDAEAIEVAKSIGDKRVKVFLGSFTHLKEEINKLGWMGKINGILLDLGVSSPQLDNPERGFSFLHDGPLDMRMDTRQRLKAADWLTKAREEEIANVLHEYGEERFSKRIAHAIVNARTTPIKTTLELATIVSKANPKWEKHKHPATRTFQALRIYINNELTELKSCLEECLDVLAIKGRLLVISFHSLEDRIVKNFIKKNRLGGELPKDLPLTKNQLPERLKPIGHAIFPSREEIICNPRSRSAILRVMEKIS